ncbi:MAG: hypothetical protein KJO34_12600, partial [Deltaproteobacteria bacterium]|nr:hypothetical protein [Deltaproteobacteria bacterium]
MPIQKLKQTLLEKISEASQKAFGQQPEQLDIGFPPATEMGHFALACFSLAKQFRQAPAEIAAKIADRIAFDNVLQEASADGPYVNIQVSTGVLFG